MLKEELPGFVGTILGLELALLGIVAIGSLQKLWSWWFLIGTLATTGPQGAFIGEFLIALKAKVILATPTTEGGD